MYQMMNMMIIIFLLSFMIMMLTTILSKKTQNDREKLTPFECGFDPLIKSRLPFSLHFFLITLIFLIFDVEIALLLPMIMIINYSNLMMWLINSSLFIYILIVGLYYEWNKGMLKWS